MSQRAVYREGELVWAKMRGHPHWPAKVVQSPKGVSRPQGKLWIFFYGTHEHAWMLPADLYCYEENRERFSLPKKIRGFAEAIWEIEEDPDLVITLGRPPSKKRRQSTVSQGESILQQTQVSVSEPPPSQPPVLSPTERKKMSSSVRVESKDCQAAGRESRYVTRHQRHGSDGIVAQITQRFAARMELKSPQTREALAAGSSGTVQCVSDSGGRSVEGEEVLLSSGGLTKTECAPAEEGEGLVVDSSTCEPHGCKEGREGCKEDRESSNGCGRRRRDGTVKRKKAQTEVVQRVTRSSGRLASVARDMSSATLDIRPKSETTDHGNQPATLEVKRQSEQVVSEVKGQSNPKVSMPEVKSESKPAVSKVKGQSEVAVSEVKGQSETDVPEVKGQNEAAVMDGQSDQPISEPAVVEVKGQRTPTVAEVMCQSELAVLEVKGQSEPLMAEVKGQSELSPLEVVCDEGVASASVSSYVASDAVESAETEELAAGVGVKAASGGLEGDGPAGVEVVSPAPANGSTDSTGGDLSRGCTDRDGAADVHSQHTDATEEDSTGKGEGLPQLCVQKSMSTVDVLMALNYNLKASLSVQAQNVQEAKAVLHQLLSAQFSSQDLRRVPELVTTIRKVRRFYGNDVVRSRAEEVYAAMKSCFQSPGRAARASQRGTMRPPMITSQSRAGGQAPNVTTGPAARCKTVGGTSCNSTRNLQSDKYNSSDQTVPSIGSA